MFSERYELIAGIILGLAVLLIGCYMYSGDSKINSDSPKELPAVDSSYNYDGHL